MKKSNTFSSEQSPYPRRIPGVEKNLLVPRTTNSFLYFVVKGAEEYLFLSVNYLSKILDLSLVYVVLHSLLVQHKPRQKVQ